MQRGRQAWKRVRGERRQRVLLSPRGEWQAEIERTNRDFELYFAPLADSDPAQFDLVVPLTIKDLAYLQQHPEWRERAMGNMPNE